MNICEPGIRRPVMVTLLMLAILFFGILSYESLPVSALPPMEYPTLNVTVSYPGASAGTMADLIAGPLERQFMINATNVNILTSTSYYENTSIIIQFAIDKDIGIGMQEVQQAINQAQNQLPSDLPSLPTYKNVNPSESPIIFLVVTSATLSRGKLYEYGYTYMGQRLSMAPGVAQIQVHGQPHAVRMNVDPQSLAAKDIGFNDLSNFVASANPNLPVGRLYGKEVAYTLQSNSQMFFSEPYDDLVITYKDGQPIKIGDVGYTNDGLQNDKFYFKLLTADTTDPCVVLAVQRQSHANTIEVSNQIMSMVDEFKKELPGEVKIWVPFNQATFIQESVDDVEFTLLLAFVLVVIIIYIYLGKMRNTIIPVVTLPLTIIGTFGAMWVLGFNLDILSLLAITLSIGFLIDDAIVVLENIVRHGQMGKKPFQAAVDGSRQIAFTVLSMSVSLCAVFIPMLYMAGVIGQLFHEFAAVIIIAIIFSGFISLTLTPMMCSRFIPPYKKDEKMTWMERFSLNVNDACLKHYKSGLAWILEHRWVAVLAGGVSLGLSVLLLLTIPTTFLPPDDIGIIEIFTQSAEGTSPYAMFEYQDQINEIIQSKPYMYTTIAISGYPTGNQGITFINLLPIGKRPPIQDLIIEYWEELNQIPGLTAYPKIFPLINLQVGSAQAGKGDYQYILQSFNPQILYPAAQKLIDAMKTSSTFRQVSSDLQVNEPQLQVEILRDQARTYQLTATDIEKALKLAYGETYVVMLDAPENQYYVVLQAEGRFERTPADLTELYVKSSITGEQVPILSVINTTFEPGPLTVNHTNGVASVTVAFDLHPGTALGPALKTLDMLAAGILPDTVKGQVEGSANIFHQAFESMWLLLILSIVVIYIILGILYENFIHPLTVLSALPLAALGALITLRIFREPLSLYAFVGIIMLLGIVLKNGIMMIDFANEKRIHDEKISPHDAIFEACLLRFRPILMTTLSTIMGALPIACGVGGSMAKGRIPLGLAIVGGLIVSQLLTLYVTPVIYTYLEEFQIRIKKKTNFFDTDPDNRTDL